MRVNCIRILYLGFVFYANIHAVFLQDFVHNARRMNIPGEEEDSLKLGPVKADDQEQEIIERKHTSCTIASLNVQPRTKIKSFKQGKRAILSCQEGYIYSDGKEEVVVLCHDGEWMEIVTDCKPIDCGSLPHIVNGRVVHWSTLFGSMAEYSCHPGYDLVIGHRVRTCRGDGKWSGLPPACQPSPSNSSDMTPVILLIIMAAVLISMRGRYKVFKKTIKDLVAGVSVQKIA